MIPVDTASNLSPIIKWPGGKEKELKYIIPNLPQFERFFDPFVGGGSVFMGINAKEYYINDFSVELISLYRDINAQDKYFFDYVKSIDSSWKAATDFFHSNTCLVDQYIRFRKEEISKEQLKNILHDFCVSKKEEILSIIGDDFKSLPCVLLKEIEINLFRKMSRMRELEIKKYELPLKDLHDNIETAIKSAVYMNFRYLYNDAALTAENPKLHGALFFFIRNYAYSGMFRYSSKGDFNVPYGGIAYNSKCLDKKIQYYQSDSLLEHFRKTKVHNDDFEVFLNRTKPTEKDFVFLDPPYDSEFSTYAQNEFTKEDQKRLADYLLNKCKAKWMVIIKNTDFIYELYNKVGINIRSFDKKYTVSFMNRNEKDVTHLIITNY